MKICILGKYPPIEGGVSASTYWLAYGLAERGHQVSVITNADEVEEAYRMRLSAGDEPLYAPVFPASGGSVTVFNTERPGPRMTHIPAHNPFATKLAGLATQVIRSRGCDALFAYYYEPYAVAAYLASSWTGVPWVVRNAGSDLDRLMAVPELGTAYKEILRAADGVLTRSSGLANRFLGMGVRGERLFQTAGYSPPAAFFHPGAPPLDVNELPKTLAPELPDGGPKAFDPAQPTIGIYGKVGITKGSFDLLHALSSLRQEGLRFQFLALTQGQGFPELARAIRDLGLDDRTWALPFLPNWRVPSFIRACTAVCFLERDFPIKIHSPVVASEVFATGGCLILSGEIARKHATGEALVDGETILLVEDPKDHAELAGKLRRVIEDPAEADRIGRRGVALAGDPGAFGRFVESYEQILARVAGGEPEARTFAAGEGDDAGELLRRMPWLTALLPTEASELAESFQKTLGPADTGDPVDAGLAFCELLRHRLQTNHLPGDKDLVEACLRFQVHRWQAQRDSEETRRQMPFAASDGLRGGRVSSPAAGALRPLRSRHAEVVELGYDVVPLFNGGDAQGVEKRPTIVCFLRAANLRRTELKLTPAVRELLELCDGSRTTDQTIETLAERRQLPPAGLPEHRKQVLAALQQLYDHRIVIFAAQPAAEEAQPPAKRA
ncbi:MAG TPA: glycosyltransferase [Thermoanaerobaculia bacterium]|jgi:glycosyltransferase involved in cell wall biosynthesis